MTLIKRKYPSFPGISDWFEDFFANDLDAFSKFKGTVPSVNIKEEEETYIIEVAAPGLSKEDFDIDIDKNILSISSGNEQKNEEEKENYTKREFCFSEFKRSFTLPETTKPDEISAIYENGILIISIPKKKKDETKIKRKITIK